MNQTTNDSEFKAALAALETRLSTPIISGELAAWIQEVSKAWDDVARLTEDSSLRAHPHQYEEMASADSELLPRIEALRTEDEAIVEECERLGNTVRRDAQHVPHLEPDEGKAQRHMQNLIDEGLAFIMRVRKQEVAVETWLVEAFNRDRGTAG